jgi:hypothetical protein
VRCEYPPCGRDLAQDVPLYVHGPEDFGRYGQGVMMLCAACTDVVHDQDDSERARWISSEVQRRWPMGPDAPRRRGESRERWIRRQARVYTERTGIKVPVSRTGTFWTIGSREFMPIDRDSHEVLMLRIMNGEITP